jgi:hypothetical protein
LSNWQLKRNHSCAFQLLYRPIAKLLNGWSTDYGYGS